MPMHPDGHGTTIVFGSGGKNAGLAMEFTSIGLGGESCEVIDTSHLATPTHMTKVAASLQESKELTLSGHFDAGQLPRTGGSDSVTITLPQLPSQSTTPDTIGPVSVIVNDYEVGEATSGEKIEGSITITPSGDYVGEITEGS